MEGFGANRSILDPRLQAARPAAGQEEAAKALRDLLASGSGRRRRPHCRTRCRSAACRRSMAHCSQAIDQARDAVEIELNSRRRQPAGAGR